MLRSKTLTLFLVLMLLGTAGAYLSIIPIELFLTEFCTFSVWVRFFGLWAEPLLKCIKLWEYLCASSHGCAYGLNIRDQSGTLDHRVQCYHRGHERHSDWSVSLRVIFLDLFCSWSSSIHRITYLVGQPSGWTCSPRKKPPSHYCARH